MATLETKICSKCNKRKYLSDFHKDKYAKDGLAFQCKDCKSNHYQNVTKGEVQRRYTLKHKFNITIKDYDEMFEKQDGVCYICGEPEISRRLSIDHNHTTGKVRKLLCVRCNTLVGHFENRNWLVDKILNYLKEHKN